MSEDENLVKQLTYGLAQKIAEEADLSDIFRVSRVESDDFYRVLKEYGKTFISPPTGAYSDIQPVRIINEEQPTWAVDAPLWTLEEGMSDLSIELTIVLGESGPTIQIDDLRVM
jgi:hypothetical protein